MSRFCSFCFKSIKEAHILVGGAGVYICDACVRKTQEMIDSPAEKARRGALPAFEGQETAQLLEYLPNVEKVSQQASEALYMTVELLRKRDVSWQKIGDALGVSRQAAWERFSG